jgi:hypothetical protein
MKDEEGKLAKCGVAFLSRTAVLGVAHNPMPSLRALPGLPAH